MARASRYLVEFIQACAFLMLSDSRTTMRLGVHSPQRDSAWPTSRALDEDGGNLFNQAFQLQLFTLEINTTCHIRA